MSSQDTETDANVSGTQEGVSFMPPPPRLTGDYQSDQITLSDYLSDIFTSQGTAQPINPADLPDPALTTIATAQQTANAAYNFATAINNALASAGITGFPVTPPTS
jgi:hypothetical protein